MAAELVDTTRLFGRGLAAIEPQWIPPLAGHLLKTQLLEPHWEKKAAEVIALERATLYGIVIYNNRRVNFGRIDPVAAREIFIREALVGDEWETRLPFLAHNRTLLQQVSELEHKSRRQDVLVDDELIFAFYDQQLPSEVCSGAALERWYREEVKKRPKLLQLTREELMRHEAAGITTAAFPRTVRLGGIDCTASYLHEPGDAKDGLTVTVPIYALNQVGEERCEWLVPGMLATKVQALVKSLHQRPRSRLVPLPEFAAEFCATVPFAQGGLLDALLKAVRERTQLAVQRNDFKLEQLQPHLFMNFRIVDEHGRQLGMGRDLAGLKAEFGVQARSAFQALAALKRETGPVPSAPSAPQPSAASPRGGRTRGAESPAQSRAGGRADVAAPPPVPGAAAGEGRGEGPPSAPAVYTAWTFGELPELMELRRGAQVLVGFPALIDRGSGVEIEVFDEPELAAARHRAGLRRLVALADPRATEVPREEYPGPDHDGGGLHEPGHAGGTARPDHRSGAGPRLPGRAAPDRRSQLQGARGGGAGAPEPHRAGGRTTGRHRAAGACRRTAQAQGQQAPTRGGRGHPGPVAAPGGQALPGADAVARAAAPAALPQGRRAAAGQAARRPGCATLPAWPNCARWNSAGCAAWPICGAPATRGWTNSAGCWRNCASACLRRSCGRRSR